MRCIKCGNESRDKFCKECKKLKRTAQCMVCQNKHKLKKLLREKEFTIERFHKFSLYSGNIKRRGVILMEYKEVDNRNTFEKLITFGTVLNCCISLSFIIEILIVEI